VLALGRDACRSRIMPNAKLKMFPPTTGLIVTIPQFRENRARPNHSMAIFGARLNIAPYDVPIQADDNQSISGVVVFLAMIWEIMKRSDIGISQKHRRTPRECLP